MDDFSVLIPLFGMISWWLHNFLSIVFRCQSLSHSKAGFCFPHFDFHLLKLGLGNTPLAAQGTPGGDSR